MDWIESFLQSYGIWAMFVLIMLEYALFTLIGGVLCAWRVAAVQGFFFFVPGSRKGEGQFLGD